MPDLTPEEVERIERGARKVLDDPRGVSYLAHCYAEKIVILAADWKRLLACCETYVFALDGNRAHIEHVEAELTRQREQIERLRQQQSKLKRLASDGYESVLMGDSKGMSSVLGDIAEILEAKPAERAE